MSAPLPDPDETEEVSPQQVAAWLATGAADRPMVIDCREAEELELCQIEGAEWIPLGQFPERLAHFRGFADRGVVVSCHHGMRSLRATRFLRQQGVARAFSMSGGIDAWSCQVDPKVPRY